MSTHNTKSSESERSTTPETHLVTVNNETSWGPVTPARAIKLAHEVSEGNTNPSCEPLTLTEAIDFLHTLANQRLSGSYTIDVTAHDDGDFQLTAYHTITHTSELTDSESRMYCERLFFSSYPFCLDPNGGSRRFYQQVVTRDPTDSVDCLCLWMEPIDNEQYTPIDKSVDIDISKAKA